MRRALILALLVALVVPWVTGANPAGAGPNREPDGPSRFRMFGAGFGHGLGLSQWGAYGLAKRGWGPSKILKHFYSGTRVAGETDPPTDLRIGLVQGKGSIRSRRRSDRSRSGSATRKRVRRSRRSPPGRRGRFAPRATST